MAEDITQDQWEDLIAKDTNAVILDVRTEEEVEDGFIPNMLNLDIRQGQGFLDEVQKLDKSKNYYVYCRSGARSAQACTLMNQMGFETTYNLIGGFMSWDGEVAE
ncbi:rhodanese-like domain-containing protein [Aquimarina sp. MMG015]|uniref:rhodanese-like domain-containing protein n=1 Tax=Aquimarina TaxID=290174 RepID=UPI0004039FF5|nr:MULTISPECIES: rhodanese-like domain-containing protein [Aquimarina]AXT56229.1 rhodanese-like domain-containing protein [Aquimarina sp. AD1]MBQ4803675.1 rhodanese-like domain-containing protein [Aquimarina sp. MMG015]RKN19400.1 rhodanese-like domain-containing protein [Aquimarina sp. AD1]